MSKLLRTEFNRTDTFELVNKVAFAIPTIDDINIKACFKDLTAMEASGDLRVIPKNASVESINNAVTQIYGEDDTPETLAAIEAGNLVYHVIPVYMRVLEASEGQAREGARKRSGFGGAASTTSNFV